MVKGWHAKSGKYLIVDNRPSQNMLMLLCTLFFHENVFICNCLQIVNTTATKRKPSENTGKSSSSLKK